MQRVKPRNRLHQRRSLPRQPLLHRIAQKLPASLLYFSPIICLTAVLGAARADCQNFITGFYHFCRNYWSTVCIPKKIPPSNASLREIGGRLWHQRYLVITTNFNRELEPFGMMWLLLRTVRPCMTCTMRWLLCFFTALLV